MRLELMDCERTLLTEIADAAMKRRDVAQTYHLAMQSREKVDWSAVNRAIMARWSAAGLTWIKGQAHSGACFR